VYQTIEDTPVFATLLIRKLTQNKSILSSMLDGPLFRKINIQRSLVITDGRRNLAEKSVSINMLNPDFHNL
jgi:hypothetical protein